MTQASKRFSNKQWEERQVQAARHELERHRELGSKSFQFFHYGHTKALRYLKKNAFEVVKLSCDELLVTLKDTK